jgi:hypothetical protein
MSSELLDSGLRRNDGHVNSWYGLSRQPKIERKKQNATVIADRDMRALPYGPLVVPSYLSRVITMFFPHAKLGIPCIAGKTIRLPLIENAEWISDGDEDMKKLLLSPSRLNAAVS